MAKPDETLAEILSTIELGDRARASLDAVADFLAITDAPVAHQATVVVGSPAGDTDIERLKWAADLHCPVLDDLRAPIPIELSWRRADAPR